MAPRKKSVRAHPTRNVPIRVKRPMSGKGGKNVAEKEVQYQKDNAMNYVPGYAQYQAGKTFIDAFSSKGTDAQRGKAAGGAAGRLAGSTAGGVAGSAFGPGGEMIGEEVGGYVGQRIGQRVGHMAGKAIQKSGIKKKISKGIKKAFGKKKKKHKKHKWI